MSFYVDFVMLFVNLHVTFRNSRKGPGYYKDFFMEASNSFYLDFSFMLTLEILVCTLGTRSCHVVFKDPLLARHHVV